MVLVSYDVATTDAAGRRRLRKIAAECTDYGRRVQYSVFECDVDPGPWELLKNQLMRIYEPEQDSLRFYFLGKNWQRRVEHYGAKKGIRTDELHII